MTHTPGPWHFDGVCQIVEVERPHMRVGFLPSDHHKYASSKPNGYLIAAAPTMLDALYSALGAIGGHFDDNCEECRTADAVIRAAIDLAEGRTEGLASAIDGAAAK